MGNRCLHSLDAGFPLQMCGHDIPCVIHSLLPPASYQSGPVSHLGMSRAPWCYPLLPWQRVRASPQPLRISRAWAWSWSSQKWTHPASTRLRCHETGPQMPIPTRPPCPGWDPGPLASPSSHHIPAPGADLPEWLSLPCLQGS